MKKITFKRKKGMTLIETIVSTALLSITVILIVAVFSSSFTIIYNSAKLKEASRNAAAGIENQLAGYGADTEVSITSQQAASMNIQFNGVTVHASGTLVESTDSGAETKFRYFVPN